MKSLLWLIAVVASGAFGYYLGIGRGAETMGAVVAQNEVTDGLVEIRVSLNALERNDPADTNKLLEKSLKSALFKIGAYSHSLAYWACTDKDRETIHAARKYAEAHPGFLNGPMQQFETQALAFCTAKVSS